MRQRRQQQRPELIEGEKVWKEILEIENRENTKGLLELLLLLLAVTGVCCCCNCSCCRVAFAVLIAAVSFAAAAAVRKEALKRFSRQTHRAVQRRKGEKN